MVPEIVHKVKCEAREAILATLPDPKDYLWNSGLGFVFYFELAEDNDASTKGAVTIPISLGSFGIGWSGGEAKTRKSIQKIEIADAFRDLAALQTCRGDLPSANYRYPITGRIALLPTVQNYVNLMRQHADASLLSVFEDELQFTTVIGGSITPSIELKPKPARLIDAEISASAERSDIHRVKLVFKPARNTLQRLAIARAQAKERARDLAKLREEKSIPERVQIVGPNGEVIDPRGFPGAPAVPPGEGTRRMQQSPPAVRSPARTQAAPSSEDIKLETLRAMERSETKAFQERFLREFERR